MNLDSYHDGQPISLEIGLGIKLPLYHHASNNYFKLLPWQPKVRRCPHPSCRHPLRFHMWVAKTRDELQKHELVSVGCFGRERTYGAEEHHRCNCSGWKEIADV